MADLISPASLLSLNSSEQILRRHKTAELMKAIDSHSHENPPMHTALHSKRCRDLRRLVRWRRIMNSWSEFEHNHPGKIRQYIRRQGIPDVLRGQLWIALGKAGGLKASQPGLFAKLLLQETVIQEAAISRDITRTFPKHQFFRDGCALGQRELFHVLRAYAAYDPEVGYCQGMGFVAAILLRFMSEDDAFFLMCALMKHREYNMRELYRPGMPKFQPAMREFAILLQRCLPALSEHLEMQGVEPGMYASQWIMTLFSYNCPFACVIRVWDVFLAEGWGVIFRVAIALLSNVQHRLMGLQFEQILNELKHLTHNCDPEDLLRRALALNIPETDLVAIFAPEEDVEGDMKSENAGTAESSIEQNEQIHGEEVTPAPVEVGDPG